MSASDLQHSLAHTLWLATVTVCKVISGIAKNTCCVTASRRDNLVVMNIDFVWLEVRGARTVLCVVNLHVCHLAKPLGALVSSDAWPSGPPTSSKWCWARQFDPPRPRRDRATILEMCLGSASPESIEAQHLQSCLLQLLGWQHGDKKLTDHVNDDKIVERESRSVFDDDSRSNKRACNNKTNR